MPPAVPRFRAGPPPAPGGLPHRLPHRLPQL